MCSIHNHSSYRARNQGKTFNSASITGKTKYDNKIEMENRTISIQRN